jgi:hypothetical protein
MMKNRAATFAAFLGALAIGVALVGALQAHSAQAVPFSAISNNAAEAAVIQDAFEASVRIQGEAARTLQTSAFGSVFVDDSAVPLSAVQKDFMQEWAPGRASGAGYLTYMTAYFQRWQDGFSSLQRVLAAQKAGQIPDPHDAALVMAPRYDPWKKPSFEYRSIQVAADGATASLQAVGDGQIYRVTLVHRAGLWYVAGEDNTPLALTH